MKVVNLKDFRKEFGPPQGTVNHSLKRTITTTTHGPSRNLVVNQSSIYRAIGIGVVSITVLSSGGFVAIVAAEAGLKLAGIFMILFGAASTYATIKSYKNNQEDLRQFIEHYKQIMKNDIFNPTIEEASNNAKSSGKALLVAYMITLAKEACSLNT